MHTYQQLADDQLIAAYRRQDQEAGEEFARRYNDKVRRWCKLHMRSLDDAEDAAQEVFIKLLLEGKLFSYRGQSHMDSWLYIVVRNTCRTLLRQKRRIPSQPMDQGMLNDLNPTPVPSAEKEVLAAETREQLNKVIDLLPERYNRAARVFYMEEQTCRSAARVLGTNPKTFAVWTMRSRQLLLKLAENSELQAGSLSAA